MTETVIFIAASGKELQKQTDEKDEKQKNNEEKRELLEKSNDDNIVREKKDEESASTIPSTTTNASAASNTEENSKNDPIAGWGKPLGLPSPLRPSSPAKHHRKSDEQDQIDTNKVSCYFLTL